MKIYKFSRHTFLNKIFESSEFLQYQFGIEPMGTQGGGGQYAFAQDPSLSYYNYQDSPYTDFYARQSGLIANLAQVTKNTSRLTITPIFTLVTLPPYQLMMTKQV